VRAFWLDGRETAGGEGHAGHGAGAMTLRTLGWEAPVRQAELLDGGCATAAAPPRR